MEFEFDKEIDALLRQTAKSEIASANLNSQSVIQNSKSVIHLDADEIAAFAENSLPEKIKLNYTAHFADCNRCRTILANIIALNSEADAVPASSIAAPQTVETTAIPWYRKLFAAPNLAYAMGALVVLFGGFFAFIALRSATDSRNAAEVSQISEPRPAASGPSASDEADFSAANMMSDSSLDAAASNTMMSNAAMTANTAANYSSNTSSAKTAGAQTPNANSAAINPTAVKNESSPNEPERETTVAAAQPTTAPTADAATESAAENRSASSKQITAVPQENNDQTKAATRAAPRTSAENLSLNGRNVTELKTARDKKAKSNADENESASRSIGGKNFTRKDNVWYDSAYNGQPTTNVSRGADGYRKLDSALRSIADNLGGTIVIVWKNKAYRIQ